MAVDAEPVQGPVAWRVMLPDGYQFVYDERMLRVIDESIHATRQPLYTAPPTRRPLTDEEIKQAVLNDPIYGAALMSMMRDGVTVAQLREAVSGIARAIERAHKIGGNDD